MKNFKFNFKSVVRNKARWLVTLFAIFSLGVGQMWGYKINSGKRLYYYNVNGWTTVGLNIWGGNWSHKQEITQLGNTKMWYVDSPTPNGWDNITAWQFYNRDNESQNSGNIDGNISSNTIFIPKSGGGHYFFTTYAYVEPAGGATIYFDNTDFDFNTSSIFLRAGFNIDDSGNKGANEAIQLTQVSGTESLYKVTLPNAYPYHLYTISNNDGWQNLNTIYNIGAENNHHVTKQIPHVSTNVTGDYTIYSTLSGGNRSYAGGDGCTYYYYNTFGGHTHNVEITDETGSISVSYKDESNADQSFTSGSRDLAHTCVITVTVNAATGYTYDEGTLTVGGEPFVSGETYTVRGDIEISASFTEHKTNVNIAAGDNGSISSPSPVTNPYPLGVATTQSVTATGNTGYCFNGWTQSGGNHVALSGHENDNPLTIRTDGTNGGTATTLTANFASIWTIKGGDSDDPDETSDDLGNWSAITANDLYYISDHSYIGTISLSAGTYKFKVYDRSSNVHWGCNTTISGYAKDYNFNSSGDNDKNCTLTISEAGEYIFAWNDADHQLTVIYPDDKAKAILKKNSIIYFDMTDGNATTEHWHNAAFTARFWFKTLAGKDYASVDKASSTMVESWYYYAPVPDCDYIGRIQMNRINPANSENVWGTAATVNVANDRTDAYQNCLVYNHASSPTISWSTYCPPMSSATLSAVNAEDKTVVYGGTGVTGDPYLVSTSANIYVSASSESELDDDNMEPYYQYYKAGVAESAYYSSSDDHIYTASSTTGTKQEMTVYAKNHYNTTYGTASPVSNSIFYEARTPYAVYIYPTNVIKASGRTGEKGAVTGASYVATFTADEGYNLPESTGDGKVIVLCATVDITNNCTWSVSDGVGTLTVPAAQVTNNLSISVTGVLKTYDIDYDGGTYGSGSLDGGTKTHFEDFTLSDNSTAFTRDNYAYDGWSVNEDGSSKDYELGGTYDTEAEQTFYPHWVAAYSVTHTLDNVTKVSGETGSIAGVSGYDYVASFRADAGYALPSTIGVTVDGSPLTKDVNYTWAISEGVGTLTINSVSVTGAIVISIDGEPVTLTFTGSNWNTASHWSPNCVPTIEHDVIIPKACFLSVPDAKAKSVTIHNYEGTPGKLYIYSQSTGAGGLIVANGIAAIHEEGGDPEPTTKNDLQINTSTYGNGGLICGAESETTKSDYCFNIKAYRLGDYYINQYIGIPFASLNVNEFYDSYMFEYDDEEDKWVNAPQTMAPFTAYNIIRAYTGGLDFTYFDGTLILPGIDDPLKYKKSLNCGTRYNASGTFDGANKEPKQDAGDHMFANSWAAPIDIASISAEDMPSTDFNRTIYIFNAGYDSGEEKIEGDYMGQWSTYPIESAVAMSYPVIPASQAFLVTSKKENATLTLDYYNHVYKPAIDKGSIDTSPLKAPRRNKAEVAGPNVLKMVVKGDSAHADKLYLIEREDFATSFDNGWDGEKVFGYDAVPQLYALSGEDKMAVNAIPDMDGTELGFKAGTIENGYTFSFEYNGTEPLYLYDKDTQEFTQISNDATYSFTTSDTDEHARFIITKSNSPAVLTAIENGNVVKRAEKFFENGQLFIKRGERMYDATGALVK